MHLLIPCCSIHVVAHAPVGLRKLAVSDWNHLDEWCRMPLIRLQFYALAVAIFFKTYYNSPLTGNPRFDYLQICEWNNTASRSNEMMPKIVLFRSPRKKLLAFSCPFINDDNLVVTAVVGTRCMTTYVRHWDWAVCVSEDPYHLLGNFMFNSPPACNVFPRFFPLDMWGEQWMRLDRLGNFILERFWFRWMSIDGLRLK